MFRSDAKEVNTMRYQGHLLLTWINFKLNWISSYMLSNVCEEIIYPLSNLNGTSVKIWEWISNFFAHFIMDVIIYHGGIKVNPF